MCVCGELFEVVVVVSQRSTRRFLRGNVAAVIHVGLCLIYRSIGSWESWHNIEK